MIKETVKYTNYNGVEVTEDLYFNLTQPELYKLQASPIVGGDFQKAAEKAVKNNDANKMLEIYEELILCSYGEKSDDGNKFIKVRNGVPLREEFSQSEAYVTLYMSILENPDKAMKFVRGVIPASLSSQIPEDVMKTIPGIESTPTT